MLKAINVPNALTTLRLILIPVFVIALEYERFDYALYIFFIASISDALDGIIARRWGLKTTLGEILDPVADKIMLVTSFVLYAYYGWLPEWLTILVISRDLVVVVGWTLLFITHKINYLPTTLGKAAIFVQFFTICYVLVYINYDVLGFLMDPLIWATAVLTVASGLQYLLRGFLVSSESSQGS